MTVGVAFTTFGYKIYFRKKYNLINGFEEAYKAVRRQTYQRRKNGQKESVADINDSRIHYTSGLNIHVL